MVPNAELANRTKVFISDVWHQAQRDPAFRGMTEAEFKQRLVEAHVAGKVELSRSDLFTDSPVRKAKEAASLANLGHAEFRLLRIPPRWN